MGENGGSAHLKELENGKKKLLITGMILIIIAGVWTKYYE